MTKHPIKKGRAADAKAPPQYFLQQVSSPSLNMLSDFVILASFGLGYFGFSARGGSASGMTSLAKPYWALRRSQAAAISPDSLAGLPAFSRPWKRIASTERRSPFLSKLKRSLARLLLAIRGGDPTSMDRAVGEILGLGEGLTPQGDDALAGLLAAFWFARTRHEHGGGEIRFFLDRTGDILHHHRLKTNAVGFSLLKYASEGRAPEPLVEFLRALALDGDGSRLSRATEKVAEIGSSTGPCLLTGAAIGLRFLAGEDLRWLHG